MKTQNLKAVSTPNEMKFNKEFEKRLLKLAKEIEKYESTGNCGNVLPFLFQCASACWCKSPYKTYLK